MRLDRWLATGWLLIAASIGMVALAIASPSLTPRMFRGLTTLSFLHTPVIPVTRPSFATKKPLAANSLVTQSLNNITAQTCSGRTVFNVVAHEDDDLLFMNPTLDHDIAAGDCVRTVYLTSGDDGRGYDYLLQRQHGSEAAYDTMLGTPQDWVAERQSIAANTSILTVTPSNNPRVSLIFLRLPDGNLNGNGFAATQYQSLQKLWDGAIPYIHSVDGRSSYSRQQLSGLLLTLLRTYRPTIVNTQANDTGHMISDHSDHLFAGTFTENAVLQYELDGGARPVLRYYIGYPIRALGSNLSADETQRKATIFFSYAKDDPGVCTSLQDCQQTKSTYFQYVSRQYTQSF